LRGSRTRTTRITRRSLRMSSKPRVSPLHRYTSISRTHNTYNTHTTHSYIQTIQIHHSPVVPTTPSRQCNLNTTPPAPTSVLVSSSPRVTSTHTSRNSALKTSSGSSHLPSASDEVGPPPRRPLSSASWHRGCRDLALASLSVEKRAGYERAVLLAATPNARQHSRVSCQAQSRTLPGLSEPGWTFEFGGDHDPPRKENKISQNQKICFVLAR
jgi:hypothetical protein